MVKVGIIGAGHFGPKLARNFYELPNAELAWVCDLRQDRLDHIAGLYPGVRTTQDYGDLLASDVDAIVIATPVSTHHAFAMQALRAGKHIFVEKPIAASVAQAMEIAETADGLRRIAMVGHIYQYNPACNVVRELICSGALGQVYYIHTTRFNLGLLQPDVNVIWDLAPHDLSILLHVLGADPFQVSASGHVFVQKRKRIHEVAYLTLYYPAGIIANVRVSWLHPVKQRRVTVVGSHKMLVYNDISEPAVVLYDKGVEVPPYSDTPEEFRMSYHSGPETVVPVPQGEPLRLECQAFVDWIRTGRPAPSDAWTGVKVVQVLEAAQRSLFNNGGRENTNL